ncbi:MAG: DHHA1 domain-containing protein [Bacilli bacterium]|nr:DHHA1 domain-containing protein [Bacilli bacterium]
MIKIDNNSDILMISHISDIDGMGSVVLSKLFSNMDIMLLSIEEVKNALNELILNNKYKKIYMCDLAIEDDLADKISGKLPITHFDHHISNIYVSNYSWSTVIPEEDGFKPSGTSLFYEYLINENIIKKTPKIDTFVEAIRANDTWDLNSKEIQLGKRLSMLFQMFGPLKFIETFLSRLKDESQEFKLSSTESFIIETKEDEMKRYIEDCDKNIIKTQIFNYNVGVVIAELYRSELGNQLSEKYKEELDFIIIIDFHRKSFSMRTVTDVDLSIVSQKFGGGGHRKAAGFPMNTENLEIFLNIIKEASKESDKSEN